MLEFEKGNDKTRRVYSAAHESWLHVQVTRVPVFTRAFAPALIFSFSVLSSLNDFDEWTAKSVQDGGRPAGHPPRPLDPAALDRRAPPADRRLSR